MGKYAPVHQADRDAMIAWARKIVGGHFLVLDTETTGLGSDAELVSVAVIDSASTTLLDTLIRPTQPIPPAATAIHRIRDADVVEAPTFAAVWPQLTTLLAGRTVIIYNAEFDLRIISQSAERAGLTHTDLYRPIDPQQGTDETLAGAVAYTCAMLQYAAYVGDWNDYHGNYRYQKLPGGDHSALGDARATLRLIQRMADVPSEPIIVQLTQEEAEHWHFHAFPIANVLASFVADLAESSRSNGSDERRLAQEWFARARLNWTSCSGAPEE